MRTPLVCLIALVAFAGHARGACAVVRAIAAGVPPEEAVKLSAPEIDAVAPPKAPDGTYVAGMSDVKAALGVTCDANALAAVKQQAPLYFQAMDHASVQDLRIGFMTDKYENETNAQHIVIVVPTDSALAEVGIKSAADFEKYAAVMPFLIGSTVYDAHALNTNPKGPVEMNPIVKGLDNGKGSTVTPLTALQPVILGKSDSASSKDATIREVLAQDPETLIFADALGNSVNEVPMDGFACNNGVSLVIVGGLMGEAASELIGAAASPEPAPTPAPPSAATSLRMGGAVLAVAAAGVAAMF